MFITTESEIVSLMPTARWNRPDQLKGWLEEEERVALEPLLGTPLYQHLCREYVRLKATYADITAATVMPVFRAKADPDIPYADVTDRLDRIQARAMPCPDTGIPQDPETVSVPAVDMALIRLIRICQQIEFYRMLSHKAGMLTVSFNEGGGMNVVTADGYDAADEKAKDRLVKDAFMSAGRAVDSLLLFLEADARGDRQFTGLWQDADAFWLHRDLLFQTARVLNEFLDIRSERMAYVQLVRDIRFCQNAYLVPRIGQRLLKAVVDHASGLLEPCCHEDGGTPAEGETQQQDGGAPDPGVLDTLCQMLRQALAFYVEGRRTELGPKGERLARRDSMGDAQQAMAMACRFVEENLDALGDAAEGSPIWNAVRARKEQEERDAGNADAACRRMCRERMEQSRRKLFTAFPSTHRSPETRPLKAK